MRQHRLRGSILLLALILSSVSLRAQIIQTLCPTVNLGNPQNWATTSLSVSPPTNPNVTSWNLVYEPVTPITLASLDVFIQLDDEVLAHISDTESLGGLRGTNITYDVEHSVLRVVDPTVAARVEGLSADIFGSGLAVEGAVRVRPGQGLDDQEIGTLPGTWGRANPGYEFEIGPEFGIDDPGGNGGFIIVDPRDIYRGGITWPEMEILPYVGDPKLVSMPSTICPHQPVAVEGLYLAENHWTISHWSCDGCNNGHIPQNSGPHHLSWDTPGTKVVKLFGTDQWGCDQVLTTTVEVKDVVPGPALDFSVDGPICERFRVSTSAPAGVTDHDVIRWSCDGCDATPGPSAGPVEMKWSTPGTKTVFVEYYNDHGCVTRAGGTVEVLLQQNGDWQGVPISLNSSVCLGGWASFSMPGLPANANTNLPPFGRAGCSSCIEHAGNANPFNSGDNLKYRWLTPGDKTLELRYSVNGCVYASNITVHVGGEQAGPSLALPTEQSCTGREIEVSAPAEASEILSWNCGGCEATPDNTTGPHLMAWNSPGVKTVTVRYRSGSQGCIKVSTGTTELIPQPPNAHGPPLVADKWTACAGSPVVFTADLPPGTRLFGPFGFDQCDGCTLIDEVRSPLRLELSWDSPGTKRVTYSAASDNGCLFSGYGEVIVAPNNISGHLSYSNVGNCGNTGKFTFVGHIPGYTYDWAFTGDNSSQSFHTTSPTQEVNVAPFGSQVKARVTVSNGFCQKTFTKVVHRPSHFWDLHLVRGANDNGSNSFMGSVYYAPSIVVRNSNDHGTVSESIEYGSPAYIYVEVHNRGNIASPAGQELLLYYLVTGGNQAFPGNWKRIGSRHLPPIPAHGSTRVEVPFHTLPTPSCGDHVHICLFAQVEDCDLPDPLTSNQPTTLVRNNNSLAWRNLDVIDNSNDCPTEYVFSGDAEVVIGDWDQSIFQWVHLQEGSGNINLPIGDVIVAQPIVADPFGGRIIPGSPFISSRFGGGFDFRGTESNRPTDFMLEDTTWSFWARIKPGNEIPMGIRFYRKPDAVIPAGLDTFFVDLQQYAVFRNPDSLSLRGGVRYALVLDSLPVFDPSGLRVEDVAEVAGNQIRVYPNPGNDLVYLSATTPIDQAVTLELRDLQGRILQTEQLPEGLDDDHLLNTGTLPTGAYVIRVAWGDRSESIRWIRRD